MNKIKNIIEKSGKEFDEKLSKTDTDGGFLVDVGEDYEATDLDVEIIKSHMSLLLQDTLKAVVEMVEAIPTIFPERESDEFEASVDITKSLIINNLKSCIK